MCLHNTKLDAARTKILLLHKEDDIEVMAEKEQNMQRKRQAEM